MVLPEFLERPFCVWFLRRQKGTALGAVGRESTPGTLRSSKRNGPSLRGNNWGHASGGNLHGSAGARSLNAVCCRLFLPPFQKFRSGLFWCLVVLGTRLDNTGCYHVDDTGVGKRNRIDPEHCNNQPILAQDTEAGRRPSATGRRMDEVARPKGAAWWPIVSLARRAGK